MSNSDYINTSGYQNLPKYPGMCRPYARNNNTLDHARNIAKNDKNANATFNPFSIYDDETVNEPHHFLVPAITKDFAKFKRTFVEVNHNKLTQRIPSSNIQSRNHHKHCANLKNCVKEHDSLLKKNDISGDYCTLSRTDKTPRLSRSNSCKNNIKKENLKNFADRFVTTDDIDHIRTEKSKCRRNSQVELSCNSNTFKKSKKQHKIDRMIDLCTCMACVKSVSYQYTRDDTGQYVDPCSCSGSSKSVACRWLCLTPLALVLPCLLCYPPAKLCQKACSSKSCRTRLKSPVDESYGEARYVKDPTEKSTFL